MAKYSEEIVKKICDLFSLGDHTVKDVCKQVNISKDTFYAWKIDKPDFSDRLKKAEDERQEAFKTMARSGLAKLLDVYEYDEVTTEDGTDNRGKPVRKVKVTRKFIMPNATAVIFALTNRDPENYKHKQEIKTDINFEGLSDEDLDKLFNRVMEGLKGNSDE